MKKQDILYIREFNRFFTNMIGVLDQHILDSSFSLPEARVLYELHQRQPCTAREIMLSLKIDKGYLSRVLMQFARKGLVSKKENKADGRATFLALTAKGNGEFEKLDQASMSQVKNMVSNLSAQQETALINHMKAIQEILKPY
jgi:DNA-binding MarR family transcriptional regulator